MSLLKALKDREYGIAGKHRLEHCTERRFLPPLAHQKLPTGTARGALCIALHPDGNMLAVAHTDRVVRVMDVSKSECPVVGSLSMKRTAWSLAFNPRASCSASCQSKRNYLLAAGDLDGEVKLLDVQAGQVGTFNVKSHLTDYQEDARSRASEASNAGRFEYRSHYEDYWRYEPGETEESSNAAAMRSCAIASLAFHPHEPILLIASANTLLFYNWQQACLNGIAKTASVFDRVRWARFDPLGSRLYTGVTFRNREQESDRERTRNRCTLRGEYQESPTVRPVDRYVHTFRNTSESDRSDDVMVVRIGTAQLSDTHANSPLRQSGSTATESGTSVSTASSSDNVPPFTHRYRYLFSDGSNMNVNPRANSTESSFSILDVTAPLPAGEAILTNADRTVSNSDTSNNDSLSRQRSASISSSVLNVVSEANRLAETASSAASAISSALETNASANEYRDEQIGSVMRALGDAHEELERIEVRMRSLRDRLRVLNTVASRHSCVENNSTGATGSSSSAGQTATTDAASSSSSSSSDAESSPEERSASGSNGLPLFNAARQFARAADAFSQQVDRLSVQSSRFTSAANSRVQTEGSVSGVVESSNSVQSTVATDSTRALTVRRPVSSPNSSGLSVPLLVNPSSPFHHRHRPHPLFARRVDPAVLTRSTTVSSSVEAVVDSVYEPSSPSTSTVPSNSLNDADNSSPSTEITGRRLPLSPSRAFRVRPSYSYYRMSQSSPRPGFDTASTSTSSNTVDSEERTESSTSTTESSAASVGPLRRRVEVRPIPLIRVEHAYARNESDARPEEHSEDPRRRARQGGTGVNTETTAPRGVYYREWATRRFGVVGGAAFLNVPPPQPSMHVPNEQAFELSGRVFTHYRNHTIEPWAVCRIQCWHLSEMLRDAEAGSLYLSCAVDLADDKRNVLVTDVLIQNDNTIDIARNGRYLACFVRRPCSDEHGTQPRVGIGSLNANSNAASAPQKYVCLISLDGASFGQQLVRISVEPQSAMLSISPESRYLLLGLAGTASRLDYLFGFSWSQAPAGRDHVIARCYELASVPSRKRKYPFVAADALDTNTNKLLRAGTGANSATALRLPIIPRMVYPPVAANRTTADEDRRVEMPSNNDSLRLVECASIVHKYPASLFGTITFDVNAVQWLPLVGQGYVYATSQGNVYVGRSLQPPHADVDAESTHAQTAADSESDSAALDEDFGFVIL